MARIVVTPSFRIEFPGGLAEFELDAVTVFDLVRQLEGMSPGAAEFIAAKVSIAVDGELIGDWSTPLTDRSEVLLVPHIAGGQEALPPPVKLIENAG